MAAVEVTLSWQGEGEVFRGGRVGGAQATIDGAGAQGPSPMTALALALAGCMAVDVLDITQKMRLSVTSLDVRVNGERREEPPRRFTALQLQYRVGGVSAVDRDKVQRAIDLSHEKYCSVWHSLRQDIAFDIELELV